MSKWHTVHLFNYKSFVANVNIDLTNEIRFKETCSTFMKSTPYLENGVSLPYQEKLNRIDDLYQLINSLIKRFEKNLMLIENETIKNSTQQSDYIREIYDYQFARFFNYLIFKQYSNYFPYVIGGTSGVVCKFEYEKAVANEILSKLQPDYSNTYFSFEEHGIVGWLTNDEVKLLEGSLGNLKPKKDSYTIGFINLVKIAAKLDYGILQGVDMYDNSVYKQISDEEINLNQIEKQEMEGLNLKE
jgi:hypothetical protein